LSFGKNQKLNFIFGTSIHPKNVQASPTEVNSQIISESDTPKVSILPCITNNLVLQESVRGSIPESDEGYLRSESSIEDNLSEVKKQLNTIAQQKHSEPEETNNERQCLHVESKVKESTKIDESKAKCYEIIERTLKMLTEYKDGIKLLHEISENLVKIESGQEISQKEKQIQMKLLVSYTQKRAQKYPLKGIEDEIEFLKAARVIYDKESVATSATYTMVDSSHNDTKKKEDKYQILIEKTKKENSLLKNIVDEIEANTKMMERELKNDVYRKQFIISIDAATQTTIETDNKRKHMLEVLTKLAKAKRQEENEDINNKLKEILGGIAALGGKSVRDKGLGISTNILSVSIGSDKNENKISALTSILLCHFGSLTNELSLNTYRRSSEATQKVDSLKNLTRTLLSVLSGSLKVKYEIKSNSMEVIQQEM